MANIQPFLSKIRTAVFGREVRGSLADGLDAVNQETETATQMTHETKIRQDILNKKYDDQIANMTNENPSISEVVDARGEYTLLRKRLDNTDVELADKADQTEINAIIAKIEQTKFQDLKEPLYICHRGAANIYPENTLEAFKGCLSQNNVIEMDVQTLVDGSLGVMHDTTIDRTSTRTGKVGDFSAMGFRNLEIDILPGYKNVNAPLFEDIVSTFGKAAIYVPESKDKKSVREIVDTLDRYDLREYSLIQSSDINDLQYAVSKGYQTLLLSNNASPDTILQNGIRYVGVSQNVSDAYIQSCISKGLKIIVYTINNRYLKNNFLSKGVSGFFTDDPFYLEEVVQPIHKDPFHNQVFFHGMTKALTYRGGFSEGNRWGFNQTSDESKPNGGRDFVLQGWADRLKDEFKITFDFKYTEHISTGWLSMALCTPNDFFDDLGPLSSGYHILLGNNGMITLYRLDGGTATKLLEISTPAIPINTRIPVEIEINRNSIKITRVDTRESNQFIDSTYRNGYLHFGRRYSNGTFGNVVIS